MATFKIVLLSHGSSQGAKSDFAGWRDVDLSDLGMHEARAAGAVMKEHGLSFQVVFASALRRSVRTTWLACMELDNCAMPVVRSWRLNDRHYGVLQDVLPEEAVAQHGKQELDSWTCEESGLPPAIEEMHASHPSRDPLYKDVPASCLPASETWVMAADRVAAYWTDNISCVVQAGCSVLVSAHIGSLAAMVWHLQGRPKGGIAKVCSEIVPGIPTLLELDANLCFNGLRPLIEQSALLSRLPFCPVAEGLNQDGGLHFDVVILGGGPVGLRAAEEAGSRGKRVALVDPKETINGAPTGAHSKCLREAVLEGAKSWEEVKKVLHVAVANTQHRAARTLRTFGVKFFCGLGTILDPGTVKVSPHGRSEFNITTDALVIATGSKSNRFPPTDFTLPGVYDSDTIWNIDRVPTKLVVQGAGIISVEYALIFAKLGAKVTMVDAFSAFLPMLDGSVQDECRKTLLESGVEIIMSAPFKSVVAKEGSTDQSPLLAVDIGDGRVLDCDVLLSACGRSGNTKNIGLETLEPHGLKLSARGGLIEVDHFGYAGCARVYAVGDCATGSMGLATMGMAQAVRAVRNLFTVSGLAKTEKGKEVKPYAIWTIPEVSWAGITEEKAKQDGLDYNAVRVDFGTTVRGCVTGEQGFLKLIYLRDSGLVLGVHLCGPGACELVNFGAEIINNRSTIFDMLHFVFPAVTYHVLYNRAATEGKLRLTGARELAATTGWKKLGDRVQKALQDKGSGRDVVEVMRSAFEAFDKEHSGIVDKSQLEGVMKELELDSSESTKDMMQHMIREATGDDVKEENIDYSSFLDMLDKQFHDGTISVRQGMSRPVGQLDDPTFHRQLSAPEPRYDLVVLGGGPCGLRAAIEAAARGKHVALIEPNRKVHGLPTGGHSKCLREAALGGAKTWAEAAAAVQVAATNAQQEASRLLRTYHVAVLHGKGSLVNETKCLFTPADDRPTAEIEADAIIIATGSKSNRFPPTDFTLPGVYDSDTIWNIDRIPKHMIVQGSGIIGVEYSLIFAMLGSKVTLVDAFPAFLPMLDGTLQQKCKETLTQNGVQVILSTPFKSVEAAPGSTAESPAIRIDLGETGVIECDTLLSACGRSGNVSDLGLEALESAGLQVKPRGKLIAVNEKCFTGCGRIYAIGDCADGSMGLATMGQMQAVRAVRDLYSVSGLASTEKRSEVKPFAIWTIPEIAWAGISEEKAKADELNYNAVVVDFNSTVRGCVTGEAGLLKLVYDRSSGVVLGVHLWGPGSTELVNFGANLVNERLSIFELLHFVFPAVTYHELYHYAAAQAKISLKGVKNLAAATAWTHLREAVARLATNGMSAEETLERAFLHFDEDNSGFLSKDNLKQAVLRVGLNPLDEDIDGMVCEATGDKDSENVDYESFLRMLKA